MAIRLTEARLRKIIREEVMRIQEISAYDKWKTTSPDDDAPYGRRGGYEEEEASHDVDFELSPDRQWIMNYIDPFIDENGACWPGSYKGKDREMYGQLLKGLIDDMNAAAVDEGDSPLTPEEIEYIYTSLCAAEDQYNPEDWG